MMTMNKGKAIIYVALGAAILVLIGGAMLTGNWFMDMDGSPSGPSFNTADPADPSSINDYMFEVFGPVLLILAVMMFGAIIGGVYIAKEDDEDDSD
jgi:NADH:ubiquinone oxidoreductase subunit 6 (subunit J)